MKDDKIVKELNTLRVILNDLTGDTEIGEYYIDVLGKAMFIVGNSKWEYNSNYFSVKCNEIAGDINIEIYHKDALIGNHEYVLSDIISDKENAEA